MHSKREDKAPQFSIISSAKYLHPEEIKFKNKALYDLFVQYLNKTTVNDHATSITDHIVAEFDDEAMKIIWFRSSGIENILGKFFLETGLDWPEEFYTWKAYDRQAKQPIAKGINEYAKGNSIIYLGERAKARIPEKVMKLMGDFAQISTPSKGSLLPESQKLDVEGPLKMAIETVTDPNIRLLLINYLLSHNDQTLSQEIKKYDQAMEALEQIWEEKIFDANNWLTNPTFQSKALMPAGSKQIVDTVVHCLKNLKSKLEEDLEIQLVDRYVISAKYNFVYENFGVRPEEVASINPEDSSIIH
jgi:hypothetical protein